MRAFYNEWEPYCCDWLSNLMDAGLITPGVIDNRSIVEIQPDDLKGFNRVHLFAGIAGHEVALNTAGWGEQEVWTWSAPCQPWSSAGNQKGFDDSRHLWPHVLRLIRARRPEVTFFEQVDAAIGQGWLDGVRSEMEGEDYAVEAVVLPACGADSPHRRSRIWGVTATGALGDCLRTRLEGHGWDVDEATGWPVEDRPVAEAGVRGVRGVVVHADADGCEPGSEAASPARQGRTAHAANRRDFQWVICHDGKARRVPSVQSGIQPLGYELPSVVGRLRAYGNAIDPAIGAEFIRTFMECMP